MTVACKICSSETQQLFTSTVLHKYTVKYFQCKNCGFIQTEEPYWLDEAYGQAISELDIGIIYRNINLSNIVEEILYRNIFNVDKECLDYGGGYGMFVRIMRDKGFDFYRHDPYCDNLFAKHFDVTDLPENKRFEILTAFEVFEHLKDPISQLEKMLELSDNIIFSTELQPQNISAPEDWWYFVPETGQHLSFYNRNSLAALARNFGLNFYTNGSHIHIFTRKTLAADPFLVPTAPSRFQRIAGLFRPAVKHSRKESLLSKDFDYVKRILKMDN
jgi:hypothetical protein